MNRSFLKVVVALAVSGLAAAARAELPSIRLTSVFPPGARAGTTVEVTVAGDDLDDLADLRFSHPGLFARPATDAAGKPQPNKFLVAVGPSVPPGVYDVRATGRFGVSTPRTFSVGDLPESVESAGNESPGGATEVAVGSTVNGACGAGAVDHFKFTAKQGQRLFVETAAREIDSRLEPMVVLTDAAGRELDRTRTGAALDFTASADGQYLLQVSDVTFHGGPAYFYRLTLSAGPHIDFVLPPAGVPGTHAKFVLYGRNLPNAAAVEGQTVDGKPLQQLPVEIDLPAANAPQPGAACLPLHRAAAPGCEYRLKTDRGVSNPVFIAFSEAATLPEPGPNDQAEQPAKIPLPCDVAGQFFPQRDRDWFTFDAKKGDVWWVDVRSHRLGRPTDPFLLVQRVTKDDKGAVKSADVQEVYGSDASAGGTDYNTAHRDPSYRLEAKEDASYRLEVRDLFNNTRDDPRLTYLLSVRKEKPDFQLVVAPARALPANAPAAPLLRRGGAVPVRVVALRRDGFNGEITVTAEGLPAGVTCSPGAIAAGAGSASLVLVASDNAPAWAGPLKFVGRADVGGVAMVREAEGACIVVNAADADPMRSRLTSDFEAAVSAGDVAPVSIEPAEAKTFEAPAGGKVSVPLKFTWRAEGTGKFKLKPQGEPPFDNATDAEVDAKAATANVELDLNKHKLAAGTHTLYVRAEGKVKYARNPEALKDATDAKAAAEKAATDAASAAKQAAGKLTAAKSAANADATKAAEKAAADADAAAKAAEQKKAEAVAKAKELEPKDTDAVLYSGPILVKVVPPPEKK